jgi:hypothetical protein
MILFRRERERRLGLAVGRVHVGALRDQRLDRVHVVVGGSQVQRAPALRVGGVDVGAVADEQARHELVVAGERGVQRGVAVGAPRSREDIGIVRDQQLGDLGVAEECGEVQRRPAVGAVVVDAGRTDRAARALTEQALHPLGFSGRAGVEDREVRAARDQQVHNFLLTMVDSG